MSKTKYHYNADTGRSGVCKATKRDCPFGDAPHAEFKTRDEANAWARGLREAQLEAEYDNINNYFAKSKKKSSKNNSNSYILSPIENEIKLPEDVFSNKVSYIDFIKHMEKLNETGDLSTYGNPLKGINWMKGVKEYAGKWDYPNIDDEDDPYHMSDKRYYDYPTVTIVDKEKFTTDLFTIYDGDFKFDEYLVDALEETGIYDGSNYHANIVNDYYGDELEGFTSNVDFDKVKEVYVMWKLSKNND